MSEEDQEHKKSKNVVKVSATLASMESLTYPLVHEVVLLADYRCRKCKDRVAGIVSKMNGDVESMEMTIMEKKVIITFMGRLRGTKKVHGKKLAIYKNILNKISNVTCFLRAR